MEEDLTAAELADLLGETPPVEEAENSEEEQDRLSLPEPTEDESEEEEETAEEAPKKGNPAKALKEAREQLKEEKAERARIQAEHEDLLRQIRKANATTLEERLALMEDNARRQEEERAYADKVEAGKVMPELFDDEDLRAIVEGMARAKRISYTEAAQKVKEKLAKDEDDTESKPKPKSTATRAAVGKPSPVRDMEKRMNSEDPRVRERAIQESLGLY